MEVCAQCTDSGNTIKMMLVQAHTAHTDSTQQLNKTSCRLLDVMKVARTCLPSLPSLGIWLSEVVSRRLPDCWLQCQSSRLAGHTSVQMRLRLANTSLKTYAQPTHVRINAGRSKTASLKHSRIPDNASKSRTASAHTNTHMDASVLMWQETTTKIMNPDWTFDRDP